MNRRQYHSEIPRKQTAHGNLQGLEAELLSSVPMMIYVNDLIEDRNVFSNRELRERLGYSEKEWESLGRRELIHPEDLEASDKAICTLRESSENSVQENEWRLRAKNGDWKWFLFRDKVYKRTPEGKVHQIIGSAVEVTHHKEMEIELRQKSQDLERYIESNTELERFAYIASHDLKEPVRTIQSFAQLLQYKFKEQTDRDAQDYINYIIEGAKRMQELIDGLLSYSRVDTQGGAFQRIEMDHLIEKVMSTIINQIQERQVQIMYEPMPNIYGDEVQIGQLIQNLVSNAIKFNDKPNPEVNLNVRMKKDDWIISVSDNGIGIEEENIEKIFNIFQRLHSADEYQGTGIGLAVCKKIVERHGGRIWVESEYGQGSSFFFSLPRPRNGVMEGK